MTVWRGQAAHTTLVRLFNDTNLFDRGLCTPDHIQRAHQLLDNLDDAFDHTAAGESIMLHPTATVHPTAILGDRVIVGPECTVGPYCYLRSRLLLTRKVVIGFGVELDRAILHDGVKIAHASCIGRSVVGENTNLGYGFVTATRRLDRRPVRAPVSVDHDDRRQYYESVRSHHGAIIGANVVCGVNVSLMPGTTVFPGTILMASESFRGVVGA